MGHSDEWTFADYFKQEQEIYRAIISAAVLCQWIAEHDTLPTDGEAEGLVIPKFRITRLIPNKIRIPKPSRESLQRKDFCIKTSG